MHARSLWHLRPRATKRGSSCHAAAPVPVLTLGVAGMSNEKLILMPKDRRQPGWLCEFTDRAACTGCLHALRTRHWEVELVAGHDAAADELSAEEERMLESYLVYAAVMADAGMVSEFVWHAVHRVPRGTLVMRRS